MKKDSLSLPVLGRPQWKSLDAQADIAPEEDGAPGFARREFMTLMGGTVALVGAACSSAPAEKILPYRDQPAGLIPGKPLHFATASTLGGYATGLLVTSHEGRPTKVEGNPEHPASLGAAGRFEQALIEQLYDPRRARTVTYRGRGATWRNFLLAQKARAQTLSQAGGENLWFLLEPSSSPLLRDLRRHIQERFPRAQLRSYAPTLDEPDMRALTLAYGRALIPYARLEQANVLVDLDCDCLDKGASRLRQARAFADRRTPGPNMNRLYVAETNLSVTGMNADHRLRVRRSEVAALAWTLAAALADEGQLRLPPEIVQLARRHGTLTKSAAWIRALARDLLQNPGRSLIVVGSGQPMEVHLLALAMNSALGNVGPCLELREPVLHDNISGFQSVKDLTAALGAGAVDTLVITAHNPVRTAPVDLGFEEGVARTGNTIALSLYENETTTKASWFLPAMHVLESWGDARAADGTISLIQPLIQPLFNGVQEAQLLAAFLNLGDLSPYDMLRNHWRPRVGTDAFETQWERWLAQGFIPDSSTAPVTASVNWTPVVDALSQWVPHRADALEINFVEDTKVYDGRFARSAWLQELPDPVTKLTWGNAALVSLGTAKESALQTGDVIRLTYRGRTLDAPVLVLPGHADKAVTLALGYGGDNKGVNAYALRHSDAPWFDGGLTFQKTGMHHAFAITQNHWSMEGRPLALEASLAEFNKSPDFTHTQRGTLPSLHDPMPGGEYAWAMSVDLNRCIGCSACVVACQSENNIPIVGEEDVRKGREMHWLRVDRYFSGDANEPDVVNQPLACVHCEKAPCEYVCPVNATVHSDEGLNEMVYNRCIGTRYCSNNCPYKVRRFNYFHYSKKTSETEKLRMNPQVTVRARGVMEKCTYCVQRIETARIDARIQGRTLREGDVVTACQQACPTRAIQFGSLTDPKATVTQLHRDPRRYDLLHELGTRPRTAYLAKIRNLNPELA